MFVFSFLFLCAIVSCILIASVYAYFFLSQTKSAHEAIRVAREKQNELQRAVDRNADRIQMIERQSAPKDGLLRAQNGISDLEEALESLKGDVAGLKQFETERSSSALSSYQLGEIMEKVLCSTCLHAHVAIVLLFL